MLQSNKKEKINIIQVSMSSMKARDTLNAKVSNCLKKNSRISYFNDYVPTYVYVLIGRN